MIAQIQDVTREDIKSLKPPASGSLYRSLVAWASIKPDAACVVEAETGREFTYARTLSAVNKMRQVLGNTPRCLVLALPGGIANAVIWISALSGGHKLVPCGYHSVRPVPFLEIHGTADRVVPYDGSLLKDYSSVTSWLLNWVQRNYCSNRPDIFLKQKTMIGEQ